MDLQITCNFSVHPKRLVLLSNVNPQIIRKISPEKIETLPLKKEEVKSNI